LIHQCAIQWRDLAAAWRDPVKRDPGAPMRHHSSHQCATIGINALLINALVYINGAIMRKALLINGIYNTLILLGIA
jgi:hypothetical protein